jgi:hypothetical protein
MSDSINILCAVFDLHEDDMANLMDVFHYVFSANASKMNEVQYVLMEDTFVVCFNRRFGRYIPV